MPKDITIYDEESDRHVHIPFEQALHATTYGHPSGVTGDLFDLENLAAKGVGSKVTFAGGNSVKAWVALGVAAKKGGPAEAMAVVDAIKKALEAGQWVPVEIVIARPFIEHLMLSAVVTVAGRDTGATLFGPAGTLLHHTLTISLLVISHMHTYTLSTCFLVHRHANLG